jgi:hypothetical protein
VLKHYNTTFILHAAFYLSKDNLGELLNQLYPARVKWYNLGLALGLHSDDLDAIRQQYNNAPDDCLREMLKAWLSTKQNPRKEDIIEALQVPSVGYASLAKDLKLERSPSSSIYPQSSHESDIEKEKKQPLSEKSAPSRTPTAEVGG